MVKLKLKLISGCFAVAFMQIAPSNAQSISPAGHYTYNRAGQRGEMRVQKVGAEWRIFVIAAGAPRGPATAADCGLIGVGGVPDFVYRPLFIFRPTSHYGE